MHIASKKGHCGVVRILLEAKADVHIKTNVGHMIVKSTVTRLYSMRLSPRQRLYPLVMSIVVTCCFLAYVMILLSNYRIAGNC